MGYQVDVNGVPIGCKWVPSGCEWLPSGCEWGTNLMRIDTRCM